jgi:two-component system nitrate/nitrite response regulator NarL
MAPTSISVLVADVRPLLLDAIARSIRQDPSLRLAAEVGDGRALLQALDRTRPDVAVVGMDLAAVDGVRVATAVTRDALPTRILILAADARSARSYDALREGAAGVLDQRVSAEYLRRAIRLAAGGRAVMCDRAQDAVTREIRLRDPVARPRVSPREREILALIADGLSAPAIGRQVHLAPTTVRTHIERLYEKLGVGERAQLVARAMREGLLE